MRRGHVLPELPNHPNKNESPESKTTLFAASSEFAIELRNGTKMKEDAKVEAKGGDVTAELPAGAFGEAFGRFQLDDDTPFDEHVDTMKTDLLTTEGHADGVLAINVKA